MTTIKRWDFDANTHVFNPTGGKFCEFIDVQQLAREVIPFVQDEVHWHSGGSGHVDCKECAANKALLERLREIIASTQP